MVNIIITFITLFILIYQFKEDYYNNRINRFSLVKKLIKSDPASLIERTLRYYKNKYKSDDSVVINHTIYKKDWVKKKYNTVAEFQKASEVLLTIQENHQDNYKKWINPLIKDSSKIGRIGNRLLPFTNLTLIYNELIFSDDSKLWNGETYAISKVHSDNGKITKLEMYKGQFFDFYNSCIGFSLESAYQKIESKNKQLKLRNKYDIFNFKNRYCTIGFTVLTIVKIINKDLKEYKEYILLHDRGVSVSESKNLLNVIPAGGFQPLINTSFMDVEKDELIANITKEFGEELKDKKNYELINNFNLIKEDEYFQKIKQNSYILGTSINPQNCFMELLLLLKMEMDEDNFNTLRTNYEGKLRTVFFNKDEILNVINTINAAPTLKELSQIVYDNFDLIKELSY